MRQFIELAAAAAAGFALAVFYDAYRLGASYLRLKKAAAYLGEILWWLAAAVLFVVFWLTLLEAVMRPAVFVWLLLGAALYGLYLRPLLWQGGSWWGKSRLYGARHKLSRQKRLGLIGRYLLGFEEYLLSKWQRPSASDDADEQF